MRFSDLPPDTPQLTTDVLGRKHVITLEERSGIWIIRRFGYTRTGGVREEGVFNLFKNETAFLVDTLRPQAEGRTRANLNELIREWQTLARTFAKQDDHKVAAALLVCSKTLKGALEERTEP